MSLTRREFCKLAGFMVGNIAFSNVLAACDFLGSKVPEANSFVRDTLLNAPLALRLESPKASFGTEYNKVWNRRYFDKPGNPDVSRVTGIIKETISQANNSAYEPFQEMGNWLDAKLTIPPQPRKTGGVELLVYPPMNNGNTDRAIFSAGYRSSDYYLNAYTSGFSNHYRDAEKKYLQVAINLCHEYQHLRDYEKIIAEGLAHGIPYLEIVRSIEGTNSYLFEARSYFLDSVLSIVFTPWENSLKPDDGESIRNTNYYQMYTLTERLINDGSSWTDSRWLNLMQELSEKGKIITHRLPPKQPDHAILPLNNLIFSRQEALPNLQFA